LFGTKRILESIESLKTKIDKLITISTQTDESNKIKALENKIKDLDKRLEKQVLENNKLEEDLKSKNEEFDKILNSKKQLQEKIAKECVDGLTDEQVNKIKGDYGELIISTALRYFFEESYIFNNYDIFKENIKEKQIDHLLINKKGIFILETKNYQSYLDEDINKAVEQAKKYQEVLIKLFSKQNEDKKYLFPNVKNKIYFINVFIMRTEESKKKNKSISNPLLMQDDFIYELQKMQNREDVFNEQEIKNILNIIYFVNKKCNDNNCNSHVEYKATKKGNLSLGCKLDKEHRNTIKDIGYFDFAKIKKR
jgi:hypothetical protein